MTASQWRRTTHGYIKDPGNQEFFATGGFWVDPFVRIGSTKELDAIAESVDAKYRIVAGLGEVKWVLGMQVERECAVRTVYISQEAFTNSALTRFNLIATLLWHLMLDHYSAVGTWSFPSLFCLWAAQTTLKRLWCPPGQDGCANER